MRSLSHLFPLVVLLSGFVSPARADSLWTAPGSTERPIIADRKGHRVGDIVTIVISESAAQSSSQSKKTNSSSAVDTSLSQFLFPRGLTHGGANPALKFKNANDFAGGGEVNNSQTITARAAVVITDVLPNGNYVIEGARRVTFSGETQHIVLHGVVRADDILPDNTLLSSSIANAKVEFISEGDLTDARRRGWLGKLYDLLRPF